MEKVRAKVICHEIVICEGWDQKLNEGKGSTCESGGTAVELQTINKAVFDMFKVKGKY